jgi:hypothetical protein
MVEERVRCALWSTSRTRGGGSSYIAYHWLRNEHGRVSCIDIDALRFCFWATGLMISSASYLLPPATFALFTDISNLVCPS